MTQYPLTAFRKLALGTRFQHIDESEEINARVFVKISKFLIAEWKDDPFLQRQEIYCFDNGIDANLNRCVKIIS